MKASLVYSLPEEESDFRNALEGRDMRLVLWDLDQWLRAKVKYAMLPAAEENAMQETRDELHRLLDEYHVRID
jgi:hypothetical protein